MATSDIYRAPIGTKDIFGFEARKWQTLINIFAKQAHLYNYDLAMTPVFEHIEVFNRVGEDTDVVSKEMYDFYDKGDRHIALRPESTAGIARVVAQHRPISPFKAWYMNQHFRYERPQKGRLREHHQFGIEAIGIDDPMIDVEIIAFAHNFFKSLGVTQYIIGINSMGDSEARAKHMIALREYFIKYVDLLGEDFALRVEKNPLRILDTKDPAWIEIAKNAPQILDFLSEQSITDFEVIKESLTNLGIPFEVIPTLVRGFDYYTNTTFEFISSSIDAAQATICAGGRYNKLVKEMGGEETPGIGFGLGIERLLMVIEAEKLEIRTRILDVFIVDLINSFESKNYFQNINSDLRNSGISVDNCFGIKSMKASMKQADRSGARFVIICGENEWDKKVITLRNMSSGEQCEMTTDMIIDYLKKH
ncbi:MAG: histidine--tRNA ligase [Acidimicrobiia bacterium]|nr:histidine--tRNA ligase [Acidimicrobiia bacterium]